VIAITGLSLLFFGTPTPMHAQDIVGLKSMLAAKQCPASETPRISYDDRDCGFSGQKACDQKYRAPSQAWQDCYHQLELCHRQIDADNKVIAEANHIYQLCHQPKSNPDQSATGAQPKAGGSSAGSDNIQQNSTSSDLASRLATQRGKNATAADVQRQQDQQFSDIVRTQQQQYQQAKAAREQAEQARRKQAPAAEGETVVDQASCSLVGRYAWNAEEYARGCPCQPGTFFDGKNGCIDNNYRNRGR
jgi:hypothetical protein